MLNEKELFDSLNNTAAIFDVATFTFDFKNSFVKAGFTEEEAVYLTGTLIQTMVQEAIKR